MNTKRVDTKETREHFKTLFELSMRNPKESLFLGKNNWVNYFEELTSNEAEMAESCFVSYDNGGAPIGYVVASPNEADHIYLSEIFIRTTARGKGFSKTMLRDVLSMNNATKIHAYVHEDNVVMQNLLESMGGTDSGKWKDYLVDTKRMS